VLPQADTSLVEAAVRTILVVDDNEVNRALLVRKHKRLGHEATAVASGVQALEAVAATPYAAVLMDCRMPEMDGMEATRRIRETEAETGRRVPIVAVTANAMEADREACFEAGMDDFLTKPVMMESLRAVLDRFVLGIGEETKATPASSAP
jgi:two-component system sensor histidine kinase/response regulator